MRIIRQFCSVLLLAFIAAQAQTPALKSYRDVKYGVTFRYPTEWAAGVGFYLPSRILSPVEPETDPVPALAQVGSNVIEANGPYAGTDFNGVEFVYAVIPNLTPVQCRKRVEALKDDPEKINEMTLNGVAYDHFSYVDAEAGHQASGEVYATASHGHCYLFEEAIHTSSTSDTKPLSAVQRRQLHDQLDQVMQSVRIENAR